MIAATTLDTNKPAAMTLSVAVLPVGDSLQSKSNDSGSDLCYWVTELVRSTEGAELLGDCSLVRRFCSPKVRKSEIKGSSFRRFFSPKVRKSDDDFYSILL